MADAQLKLSRRSLLAAACASPVLSKVQRPALPVSAAPAVRFERSREAPTSADEALLPDWTHALSRFRSAEAAVAALEGTRDDDAFNAAAEAQDRALERLLLAPAPDLASLAAKLALARRHQAWELAQGDALMAAIEQDASRLS
jgi:hypothetical protein